MRSSLLNRSLMMNVNVMFFSSSLHSKFLAQSNKNSCVATMNLCCFRRKFSFSSQPLQPVPFPRPMETHLWYMIPEEVTDSSLLEKYLEILPPYEKESVLRLQEDGTMKRALLARALVRTTIARYQASPYVDPISLKFKKNSYGKPEVDWQCTGENTPPLHFNLSHTSSLIACGITIHSPVGIDVEEKGRTIKSNVLAFARRFFCQQEVEHLENILDPELQREEFIKLWTLKESYVKALGRGFSACPFKTFRVHFKAPSIHVSNINCVANSEVSDDVESTDVPNGKWQFALLELADTHYASICLEKDASFEEDEDSAMGLRVWKSIPFLEDLCMSGTPSVVTLGGRIKQLKSFT